MNPRQLKEIAYYGTGGTFDQFLTPATPEELAQQMREIASKRTKLMILGGGTNTLVMDRHWDGAVLVFSSLVRLDVSGSSITVGAGVENSSVARAAHQHGLQGAGWMYRLPGQIGGTVRMNARCYGGEISQIASRVVAVTRDGQIRRYADPGIFRGYKDTIFMENGEIVVEAELELAPGDPSAIEKEMNFCETDRTSKGQFEYPTCGCVFKNNYQVGVPSGMLLDASGVKALGGSRVSINPHHANFVYNKGATSDEILELTFEMRELVYREFGVWLEYEMEILGNLTPEQAKRFHDAKPESWRQDKIDKLRERFVKR